MVYAKTTAAMFLLLIFSACAAKHVGVTPSPPENEVEAAKLIERVFYEQPPKYRPESTIVTADYIGFSDGRSAKSRGLASVTPLGNGHFAISSGRTVVKELESRLYFDSIGDTLLYTKRKWFIVQLRDDAGRTFRNVYLRREDLASRFIGALDFFKKKSR